MIKSSGGSVEIDEKGVVDLGLHGFGGCEIQKRLRLLCGIHRCHTHIHTSVPVLSCTNGHMSIVRGIFIYIRKVKAYLLTHLLRVEIRIHG